MNSKSHYYLWLKPAEPELTRLRELIRNLSKKYSTPAFEPHVTLVSQLNGSASELSEPITSLAGNTRVFSLDGLVPGCKDEFYRCIFLEVAPSPPLMLLYQQAVSALPNNDKRVFEPHVSLVYGDLSSSAKQDIITELQHDYPQSIPIDRLALYSAEGAVKDWRLVREFTLSR